MSYEGNSLSATPDIKLRRELTPAAAAAAQLNRQRDRVSFDLEMLAEDVVIKREACQARSLKVGNDKNERIEKN